MKEEFQSKGSLLWYKDGTTFLTQTWGLNRGTLLNIILGNLGVHRHAKVKSNWHGAIEPHTHHYDHYQQVTPRSIDHLIQAVDDEPNDEIEEDPEEDPREPTEEMEEDPEEYSEHDPNLYDPRDGGVMHVLTVKDAHSEYGSIGFYERKDSNNWEWKIDESPEYHPGPYYVVDDDDDDAPTWP
ncbi:hypothetical protein H5410_048401 [Solanum commersonii]|uniref:Uncharacterized protein n=1 Tax=Solanum commersonii TaxID=4109 RepID=A0A9J5XKA4_SOLCO|nr:hypothetical protein H5410_048401 [Solanum commersonii]